MFLATENLASRAQSYILRLPLNSRARLKTRRPSDTGVESRVVGNDLRTWHCSTRIAVKPEVTGETGNCTSIGKRRSLQLCEAVRDLELNLFTTTLSFGVILVDWGLPKVHNLLNFSDLPLLPAAGFTSTRAPWGSSSALPVNTAPQRGPVGPPANHGRRCKTTYREVDTCVS